MNRGLSIDPKQMEAEIEQEMKLYNDQLKDMLNDNENAKKAENVGEFRLKVKVRICLRIRFKMLRIRLRILSLI